MVTNKYVMGYRKYKYGVFKDTQVEKYKRIMRKSIFFLLLCVDPATKDEYENIDVNKTFDDILYKLSGFNELLFYPVEMVSIISLIEMARIEFNKSDFDFSVYRKLILDAGAEVLKIKESDFIA